ncbi:MAG: hypothetical protein AB7E80_00270 [Hyphomicrobiaceae bacterium]
MKAELGRQGLLALCVAFTAVGPELAAAEKQSDRAGTPVMVIGRVGYLSEWEVSAAASAVAHGQGAYSGTLALKHVGACTVNGPVTKSGDIRFWREGLFRSEIVGTMNFADERCTFRVLSAAPHGGYLRCGAAGGVPLTLEVKWAGE